MFKLGIIGCGNVGSFVMKNLRKDEFSQFSLQIVADVAANVDVGQLEFVEAFKSG